VTTPTYEPDHMAQAREHVQLLREAARHTREGRVERAIECDRKAYALYSAAWSNGVDLDKVEFSEGVKP